MPESVNLLISNPYIKMCWFMCCVSSSVDLVTLGANQYQYTDILIWKWKPANSSLYGISTWCACIYFRTLDIILTTYYPYFRPLALAKICCVQIVSTFTFYLCVLCLSLYISPWVFILTCDWQMYHTYSYVFISVYYTGPYICCMLVILFQACTPVISGTH